MSDAQLIAIYVAIIIVGVLMMAYSFTRPVEDDWPDEWDLGDEAYEFHGGSVGEELSVRLAMATGKCVIVNWNGEGYDVDLHGAEPPDWLGEDFRGHPITITG